MKQTSSDPSVKRAPAADSASGAILAPLACAFAVAAIVHVLYPLPLAALLATPAIVLGAFAILQRSLATSRILSISLAAAGFVIGIAALILVLTLGEGILGHGTAPSIGPSAADSAAMQEAREQSKRLRCVTNLRAIGRGLLIYCQEWNDRLPDDLIRLDEEGYVRPDELQSPLDENTSNTCDYYYVPKIRPFGARKGWLMAWGDPAYSSDFGASVLYVDGHTVFLEPAELDKVIARFIEEYEQEYGSPPQIIEPY